MVIIRESAFKSNLYNELAHSCKTINHTVCNNLSLFYFSLTKPRDNSKKLNLVRATPLPHAPPGTAVISAGTLVPPTLLPTQGEARLGFRWQRTP